MTAAQAPLVEVRDLQLHYPVSGGGWLPSGTAARVKAVDGVSFDIRRGETLGLVGESGCGKTSIGRCILQLERLTGGSVRYGGVDLATLRRDALIRYRQRVQVVFQDPYSSLNPRMTVGAILAEPMQVHRILPDVRARRRRVDELLDRVGLSAVHAGRYPHELSGGQRQRVGIARALALEPEFIVCDEAVSALDVSIQAQVINLLEDLRESLGLTYLFISHDLGVVRHICDRVAVMYLGKLVELAETETLFEAPRHPYTQLLLDAVPVPDPAVEAARRHRTIQGEVPSALNPPPGCVFHPRCSIAVPACRRDVPRFAEAAPAHWLACPET